VCLSTSSANADPATDNIESNVIVNIFVEYSIILYLSLFLIFKKKM